MSALAKSVAIIEFDREGTIFDVNENYAELTGYEIDEIVGKNHTLFIDDSERKSAEYIQFWSELCAGQFQSAEFRRIGKGGKVFWIRGSYNPVFDEAGSVVRIVKFAMDITERKELEARLVAASQAKDLLLANISHELRTPLNSMIGLLDALDVTDLNERQHQMVEIITNSGHTLERILGDMLEFTRISAGKIAIETRLFPVKSEVEAAIFFHREAAIEKGLTFDLLIDPSMPEAIALDPTRVKQVLSNLVSNAVKFTDTGRVAVAVSPVGEGDGARRMRLAVSDTGIGIDPARVEELFEPFTQADPSISRRFGGTGLGLAICRSLAHALGGSLTAEGRPGSGSTFIFETPYEIPEVVEVAERTPRELGSVLSELKPRILLADDHPSNRLVIELMLAPFGGQVISVADGAAAIAAFVADPPACVLMDMQMPVLDGLEATRQIRKFETDQGLKRTPIIMITANALDVHQKMALSAGVDMVLTKPIRLSALISSVESFL